MKKCPCCFEDVIENLKEGKCPFCGSFIENNLVELSYPSVNRKRCYFCGKSIAKEAKYCRYCRKWIEEAERNVRLLEEMEKEDKNY